MDGGNVELTKLSIQAPWREYRGRGKSYPTSIVFVFWNWYLLFFKSYNQLVNRLLIGLIKQAIFWVTQKPDFICFTIGGKLQFSSFKFAVKQNQF